MTNNSDLFATKSFYKGCTICAPIDHNIEMQLISNSKIKFYIVEFKLEGTVSAGNQFQRKPITKKLEGMYLYNDLILNV